MQRGHKSILQYPAVFIKFAVLAINRLLGFCIQFISSSYNLRLLWCWETLFLAWRRCKFACILSYTQHSHTNPHLSWHLWFLYPIHYNLLSEILKPIFSIFHPNYTLKDYICNLILCILLYFF